MLQVRPTPSGGRVVNGDTPYGRFRVEWDRNGQLMNESMLILTPSALDANGHGMVGSPERTKQRSQGQPHVQATPPKLKGPGDHLHDVILESTGIKPHGTCGCEALIARMNAWDMAGCREHREQILAHLMGQVDQLPKAQRWALTLPGGKWLARHVAERMFEAAMHRTEATHG